METMPTDIREEAALVRRARWGDQRAFETLYDRHAGAIHALAYRLTGDRGAAEDITQDTFLRMVQFIGGLRGDRPLRPWLKRVAANAAIDRLRRERLVSGSIEADALVDGAPAMDTGLDASTLLRRLPADIRTLVWLHTVEGWTHAELAQRFGRSESWSKSIVSRALQQLRAHPDTRSDHMPP
ncbi:RNA polymerase sigma factor [Luteimonas terrae]|uniref:RNA polymerase sigma factor n=1 Tax=Luteimonas terrae TaxID=1530191 RepID=A0A4R5UBM2_9GAMM|nr:RNA polymerase sigma factor [Luteimonas terrae]TDK32609.1 RNA polymerase sigma factor [Luteimonas terrae]